MSTFRIGVPPSLGVSEAGDRAAAIADELTRATLLEIEAESASSYKLLRGSLLDGRCACAWAPPVLCGEALDEGSAAVLIAVRGGAASYRSALVARADSGITLQSLLNRSAAWVDPASMAGFLLPMAVLRREGIDPKQALPHQRFVGSHKAVLNAVVARTADVGAVFLPAARTSAPQESFAGLVGPWARELVVLALSPECPNDGLALSPALAAGAADELLGAFMRLPTTNRGREALRAAFECDDLMLAPRGVYQPVVRLMRAYGEPSGEVPW